MEWQSENCPSYLMGIEKIIGKNTKKYRLAAKLSQEALAALLPHLNADQAYISRLESGQKNLTVTTLQQIADALDIEPSALLERPRK